MYLRDLEYDALKDVLPWRTRPRTKNCFKLVHTYDYSNLFNVLDWF